jgi:hypothetical protein
MMERGWLTHLATNGAGSIHDWELAWCGSTGENVRENVANGTFGLWHETASNIHLAIMAGALVGLGYGQALGQFIVNDGVILPSAEELTMQIAVKPEDPLTPARADLLQAMHMQHWPVGAINVRHRFWRSSVLAQALRHQVPLTVHPGIGYDIISNHPIFNGAVIGRGAERDFKLFSASVDGLDGGVVLCVGSAIMGPQVFEKSLSCVNNLRLRDARAPVSGHSFYVVDLHDGGGWDWSRGEPAKDSPAYYLRFCKTFARMGGTMSYLPCDNIVFLHRLYYELNRLAA